ncbi:unnamed protein product [Sphagnum balticum]
MPVEDHKQALYLDASIAQMPLKMISPVESEERVSGSGGAAVPVREAIGESVSKLDEVEEVKHVHGQALKKPMGLLGSHHVNGNALKLAAKPVGKVDKNSPPAGDKFEKPVGVGAKVSSDHGKIKLLKEAISCDAEEENKLSHPYGENKSGIWNPKLSPTKARVSDVSDLPSLPMELLHKQGASIRQAGDVTKSSSPGFHQPTFVKYGSMRSASQAVGAQSLIKQISLEERGGLDHFADTLEEPKASTVPQMTEDNNLSTLKNSETKKAAAGAILIKTVSKSNNHARKSKEVSSSSSSSKSTDAATVVSRNITLANTTERILFCSSIVHKLMYEATELSGEKERHSFSISPDLKLFANAGILTKPEKHRPGGGSSKQKGGHEQKGEMKENVSMHPTETVRLNFELNSNVNKVNDKCCCVIL